MDLGSVLLGEVQDANRTKSVSLSSMKVCELRPFLPQLVRQRGCSVWLACVRSGWMNVWRSAAATMLCWVFDTYDSAFRIQ